MNFKEASALLILFENPKGNTNNAMNYAQSILCEMIYPAKKL